METLTRKLHLTPGGEVQKHMMTTITKSINVIDKSTDGQSVVFELKADAVIHHDEHAPMVLTPGHYQKTNQVEYNPFDDTIAYVFD